MDYCTDRNIYDRNTSYRDKEETKSIRKGKNYVMGERVHQSNSFLLLKPIMLYYNINTQNIVSVQLRSRV